MCLVIVTQMIMVTNMIIQYLYKKPYLRTNYIEANIEEDIELKNEYKKKN